MLSQPHLRLLPVLAFFAVAQANWFDSVNIFGRQDVNSGLLGSITNGVSVQLSTGVSSTPTPTKTSTISKTSTIPSSTPSSSSTPITSSAPVSSESPSSTPSSTPESTSTSSATEQKSSSSSSSSTPISDKTSTSPTETPTTTQAPTIVVETTTIDGKTYTSSSTASTSSSSSTATNAASLTGNDTTKSSGMSSKTRNTVIGVVVGVAGAIILGGLFFVAWRIWGRKKNEDESDGLMGFRTGSAGHEKTGSVSAGNPFQSTLDQYHAPNKNVNASSNF